tara:strand:- start:33982 stop:34587 length:606 start_codon:yes stop_codon:yes gene_type:complete
MLGGLFQKKNLKSKDNKAVAGQLYACALYNTRESVFYEEYGVPDTFDGRFDLLLVHVFITLNVLIGHERYEKLSQALFDRVFQDMDQTLREMGIGDMGVPKHMKRMMKAFNGRMHSYQLAIDPSSMDEQDIEGLTPTTLKDALKRNLYGTVADGDEWDEGVLAAMDNFITTNIHDKTPERIDEILDGRIVYVNDKRKDNLS